MLIRIFNACIFNSGASIVSAYVVAFPKSKGCCRILIAVKVIPRLSHLYIENRLNTDYGWAL